MDDKLYSSLEKNKLQLKQNFDNSADYFFKPVKIFNKNCAVVMCEDLTDSMKLWEVFLKPLPCRPWRGTLASGHKPR